MIDLTGKLIAAIVPDDVTKVRITNNQFTSKINETLNLNYAFLQYGTNDFTYYSPKNFYLPEGSWKKVGFIQQSGQLDFDFNSTIMDVWEYGLESKKTFLSLLNSKGIFLDQLQNQKVLILEKA